MLYTNCGKDAHGPFDDARLVPLTRGEVRADAVNAATPATLTHSGVDANGDVTYTAGGGLWGNSVTVEHAVGLTGGGNEDRALGIVVTSDYEIIVTFGTDGAGDSAPPTATALASAINADADAALLVDATAGGTGASLVGDHPKTSLSGGLNDGDHLIIQRRYTQQVAKREVI
jgi:hypothetical protein